MKTNDVSVVDEAAVLRIAALAHLSLTAKEVTRLSSQLGATVTAVSRLSEIDTAAVSFPPQITGLVNVLREDVVEPSLVIDDVLRSAPRTWKGYVLVEAVFSE